jgi:hypothetical protein
MSGADAVLACPEVKLPKVRANARRTLRPVLRTVFMFIVFSFGKAIRKELFSFMIDDCYLRFELVEHENDDQMNNVHLMQNRIESNRRGVPEALSHL